MLIQIVHLYFYCMLKHVGYLFWDEIPVLTTWIGAAVIASSGLFIFVRKQAKLSDEKVVISD